MIEKTLPYDEKKAIAALKDVSTATITTILLKKGLRNVWMRKVFPIKPGWPRIVGRAFTLRFVPAREDLATPESWSSPISTRAAVEAMPEGVIAVVDAMGITDAGIFGDILCARMARRGVAALVTDGVVRDVAGVLGTGLPVWSAGVAAPPSVAGLTFVNWQEPVGCGGVAVFPDDLIVVDDDGAVLIPAALVDKVVEEGIEQERFERWIMGEVENGHVLPGLYPPNAENRARYEAWKASQSS
jgi:regulator of RNase E activity RraA